MKKKYEQPILEKIRFTFAEQVVAAEEIRHTVGAARRTDENNYEPKKESSSVVALS